MCQRDADASLAGQEGRWWQPLYVHFCAAVIAATAFFGERKRQNGAVVGLLWCRKGESLEVGSGERTESETCPKVIIIILIIAMALDVDTVDALVFFGRSLKISPTDAMRGYSRKNSRRENALNFKFSPHTAR